MEGLANLTRADISNGALMRMLAKAGIPDVQEYVKRFHYETEELIKEEFEHPTINKVENDEQIVPPAEIHSWIAGFRPNLDTSIQPILIQEEKDKHPPPPADVQSWITGLRLRLDDPAVPPATSPAAAQPQPTHKSPTDLNSWLHLTTPIGLHSSIATPVVTTDETTITRDDDPSVTGNLSTWLTDWSKSLAEQPPPTSLDSWLQRLVPTNMHEPLTKGNSAKGRLNSYLNAAQEVLSQHGYDVATTQAKPTAVAPAKSGMFGNVKQMYFLWKVLDKNNDRKITVEDVQILLQEMGLGFLSKYVAQTLFEMVDTDHDGALQFRDFVAMMGIIKQLVGAVGSTKA